MKGKLDIPEIESECLTKLNLATVSAFQDGYSLHLKKEIGYRAIDLSAGDKTTLGKYSFTTGFNNSSLGNYATIGISNTNEGEFNMTVGSNLINKYPILC